ncbi:MAG: anti-sigma factor [Candidatus Dormibacteraeota bacterium]|nr:anti-sigma factor [Candidatus Dormibacteraeota bacterium]
MSEHEEFESLVAAWVLGAVTADEVDVVRTHIETCQSCRDTASRLSRIVGALPLDVEEKEPPARLRDRILAAAAASRVAGAAPARPRTLIREIRLSSRTKDLSGTPRGLPMVGAAAAVLLALVVGLVVGDLIGGAPVSAPVTRSALVGHQGLAGAKASVINLKSDGIALVVFSGLPQLDSGRVYEVWLITAGGRADPAGVFVPDRTGSEALVIDKALVGYAEMAITSELGPAGTLAPTQQPQLYGNLA